MNTGVFEIPNQKETEQSSGKIAEDALCLIRSTSIVRQLRLSVQEKAAQKDYTEAIALLDRLIACDPDSAIDYNNRGLMHFYQGQFLKAIQDYDRAIAIDNKLDNAYNNRANCYAAQGDFLAALNDYEQALNLNPSNLKALINQGVTFRELGLYDLALENFETTLILGLEFQGRIYAEKGYTYHLRGDWNCAIGDYRRALALLSIHDSYRQKVETWLDELLIPIVPNKKKADAT
jgi:tetratricopeptide (TPR) repeat protein